MKVYRIGGQRGVLDREYCTFLIYDETKTVDEVELARQAQVSCLPNLPVDMKEEVLKNAIEIFKSNRGPAFGQLVICTFWIYRNKEIVFNFNIDEVTLSDLKKITRLAKAAQRRVKFKEKVPA